MSNGRRQYLCVFITFALTLVSAVPTGAAMSFANGAFAAQWKAGEAITPNFWGPLKNATVGVQEPYAEASLGFSESGPMNPGQGMRLVQYFDKGRMEINAPASGKVTNGLLATEIVTGQIQVGNNAFQAKAPPTIPIAGDPDNAGPTYADLSGKAASLLTPATANIGTFITTMVASDGTVSDGGGFAGISMSPKIAAFDDATKHNVLDQFVTYRAKVGLSAIGYARSEPFRANVKVAGQQQSVIAQVFERRVLTYTAANPAAFRVEFGNIGQHYYQWRYSSAMPTPFAVGSTLPNDSSTVAGGDPATAAAQLLPAGFAIKNVRTVDLGGDTNLQAVGVADNPNAQGIARIAFLLVSQGDQWKIAFRTMPDTDATADIAAYPKNAQHPGFVVASYHLCGANCNGGEHFVLRYDGNGALTPIVRGTDDRGSITGDANSGRVSLAAPLYRIRDGNCCPSYRYSRVWNWSSGTLVAEPFTFAVGEGSKATLPDWLALDGPALLPFLAPLQTDQPDGAAIGNLLRDPLPVTDTKGTVCSAPAAAIGAAFASIGSSSIGALWKDGASYKATLDFTDASGSDLPATQAGNCALGGPGVGGYVVTIAVGPQAPRIIAMQALANTYAIVPDDAISSLPT